MCEHQEENAFTDPGRALLEQLAAANKATRERNVTVSPDFAPI